MIDEHLRHLPTLQHAPQIWQTWFSPTPSDALCWGTFVDCARQLSICPCLLLWFHIHFACFFLFLLLPTLGLWVKSDLNHKKKVLTFRCDIATLMALIPLWIDVIILLWYKQLCCTQKSSPVTQGYLNVILPALSANMHLDWPSAFHVFSASLQLPFLGCDLRQHVNPSRLIPVSITLTE